LMVPCVFAKDRFGMASEWTVFVDEADTDARW